MKITSFGGQYNCETGMSILTRTFIFWEFLLLRQKLCQNVLLPPGKKVFLPHSFYPEGRNVSTLTNDYQMLIKLVFFSN